MAERGIIMSAPMVRALLDGRKTQTRQRLKPQPGLFLVSDDGTLCDVGLMHMDGDPWPRVTTGRVITRQEVRFALGLRLWVKETFVLEDDREYVGMEALPNDGRPIQHHEHPDWGHWHKIPHYRATEPEPHIVGEREDPDDDRTRWTSPIFMPRWASRLTLTVTDVRVQRLQEISEEDALAEGVDPLASQIVSYQGAWRDGVIAGSHEVRTLVPAYRDLWNSIHGPGAWDENPWVVAVSFSVEQRGKDHG